MKQMNLQKMRLEDWIFLLSFSLRGSSIVHCAVLYTFDMTVIRFLQPKWFVNSLQCSYKRKLPGPAGKTQNVEQETGHVLRFKFVLCFCNVSVKWLFSCHVNHFPPGQLRMVFSILILHSNPGDFLFLDKFTSTGFINKIYSMEASIFFFKNLITSM